MEVSCHAIDLHRVDAVRFAVAAFTNLTQDHLDYHHTLEEYFAVKRRLFTDFESAAARSSTSTTRYGGAARRARSTAVLHGGPRPPRRCPGRGRGARAGSSAVHAGDARRARASVDLPLRRCLQREQRARRGRLRAGARHRRSTTIVARAGEPRRRSRAVSSASTCGQPFAVLVDYAHTPDCAGEGDRGGARRHAGPRHRRVRLRRRPRSGQAPAHGRGGRARRPTSSIVTSDNPRSEDPGGHHPRRSRTACSGSGARIRGRGRPAAGDRAGALRSREPGDAVLIAGKGHEDYQIFADRTIHFDDREVAREELRAPMLTAAVETIARGDRRRAARGQPRRRSPTASRSTRAR